MPTWQPVFADRAAVVRQRRPRAPCAPDVRRRRSSGRRQPSAGPVAGAHRAARRADGRTGRPRCRIAPIARAGLQPAPPAGLLPINAINLDVLPLNLGSEVLQSRFFPPGSSSTPCRCRCRSSMSRSARRRRSPPIDFSTAERVRVLVPVTQASYEPRLLYRGGRRRGIPADARSFPPRRDAGARRASGSAHRHRRVDRADHRHHSGVPAPEGDRWRSSQNRWRRGVRRRPAADRRVRRFLRRPPHTSGGRPASTRFPRRSPRRPRWLATVHSMRGSTSTPTILPRR